MAAERKLGVCKGWPEVDVDERLREVAGLGRNTEA